MRQAYRELSDDGGRQQGGRSSNRRRIGFALWTWVALAFLGLSLFFVAGVIPDLNSYGAIISGALAVLLGGISKQLHRESPTAKDRPRYSGRPTGIIAIALICATLALLFAAGIFAVPNGVTITFSFLAFVTSGLAVTLGTERDGREGRSRYTVAWSLISLCTALAFLSAKGLVFAQPVIFPVVFSVLAFGVGCALIWSHKDRTSKKRLAYMLPWLMVTACIAFLSLWVSGNILDLGSLTGDTMLPVTATLLAVSFVFSAVATRFLRVQYKHGDLRHRYYLILAALGLITFILLPLVFPGFKSGFTPEAFKVFGAVFPVAIAVLCIIGISYFGMHEERIAVPVSRAQPVVAGSASSSPSPTDTAAKRWGLHLIDGSTHEQKTTPKEKAILEILTKIQETDDWKNGISQALKTKIPETIQQVLSELPNFEAIDAEELFNAIHGQVKVVADANKADQQPESSSAHGVSGMFVQLTELGRKKCLEKEELAKFLRETFPVVEGDLVPTSPVIAAEQ